MSETVQGTSATTASLRYEGLNRLTSFERRLANGTPLTSETFTLDAATNLATRTGPAATFSYDGANRLLSDGARSFTWDGADRLTDRGADSFGYDALSRLVSSTVGGTPRSYAYDGDGLLRARTQGALTTSFLWDSAVAPAPLLVAGSDRLVHGLGPLYAVHGDSTYDTYARDALGSVRAEVSGKGRITNAYDYAAYGALRASLAGPPRLLGFTGEPTDPSGLVYLRSRWYDASVGRFLSRDPFNGVAELPITQNLYAYAAANPVRFADPSGNCPFCLVMAVGALAGATINASVYVLTTRQAGDFTWGGLAGAAVTGAIIGAVAPIAGPAGGTAGGLWATAAINAASGAAGYYLGGRTSNAVNSLTGGRTNWSPTVEGFIFTAAGSVLGGAIGERVAPMIGVHTLKQLGRFAPRTWSGFMQQGANMQALEGSAFVGALYGSAIALLGESPK